MKIGDVLIPNEYLRANNKPISGIIIGMEDPWGWGGESYKIALNNGNIVWKSEPDILDLWEVLDHENR